MDYMDRRRRLHPRLAMMAALLDDWSLPFTRGASGTPGRRGSGLTFPKWLLDDGEDDADDQPVLRRSRSTWATWPSMDGDGGRARWLLDAEDEPWWTASTPRDQEELRAARRRYFEPRHQDRDDADDDRRVSFRDVPIRTSDRRHDAPAREVPVNRNASARVSFHDEEPASPMHARVRDFLRRGASAGRDVPGTEDAPVARVARDVPITLRRDSSEESPPPRTPYRDIPSSTGSAEPRGIPLKRDSTVIEVVPAKQASVTRDIPITRDVFIARDADVTRDTPVSRDIAVRMDSTFTGDANPGKDIPVTREVPVTRVSPVTVDIPVTREVPVTRVSPVTVDIPVTRVSPLTVDIPVTRDSPVTPSAVHDSDAPSFNYATPAWTGAAEGDAEADSATEDVEQDGSLVPRRLLRDEQKRCLQLQDENLRLKAVITTIQETNKRWQSFNAARQAYIQRLLSTIEEQQVQLNACLDALKTPTPPPAAKPARTAPTPATPATTTPTSAAPTSAAPTSAAPTSATPTSAAPAPTTTVLDAEGRLKRLQGEVSDLHRRLQEAKKEHRDTVSMLQQVSTASTQPPESTRPDYQSAAAATEKPPTEAARREHDKHCTEESASLAAARLRGTSPRHDPTPPRSPVAPPRPCYYDVVTDSPATPASPAATTTTPLFVEREREATQYSFNGDALHQHMQQHRGASPALSDALTPTPTPPPTLHRHTVRQHEEQHDDGYPVELSGSCSSLCSYSGPAPHISMASSSRATTPDQDVSMCSDATLDCSPPSPVQTCDRDRDRGRADPFWRGLGLRLF